MRGWSEVPACCARDARGTPWIVPLFFLYYSCSLPVVFDDLPALYGHAASAAWARWDPFRTWQARAESEMLTGVFIRLLITILMTLSAHAAFDRTNTLATKLDALFADYRQPGSPGASVMVIKRGNVIFAKGYGLANLEEKIPCQRRRH